MDWNKYQNQYQKEHYDSLKIRVQKGEGEKIKEQAKKEGLTINAYVLNCIKEHEKRKHEN